jgi:hypothetical protein
MDVGGHNVAIDIRPTHVVTHLPQALVEGEIDLSGRVGVARSWDFFGPIEIG